MSENLQYEDEMNRRFDDDDLPMPDMDQSWQKMKQKLDEDKRRRFPPFLLNSCLVGVLLIGIVGLVWFFWKGPDNDKQTADIVTGINKEQPLTKKLEASKNQQAKVAEENAGTVTPPDTKQYTGKAAELPNKDTDKNKSITNQEITVKPPAQKATGSIVFTSRKKEPATLVKQTAIAKKKSVTEAEYRNTFKTQTGATNKGRTTANQLKDAVAADTLTRSNVGFAERIDTNTTYTQVPNESDSLLAKHTVQQPVKDTSLNKVGATSPNKAKEAKTDERKSLYLAAGIAVQQQIPLKGQKAVPYNAYGRSGSGADYIPSVYLRLYRPKKWFIQTEFKYGAPQTTKQFTYNKTRVDSFGVAVTSRYSSLKKTYYHQLPVSFNYFVLRNFSIGVGAMYSIFYGAVTEEETKSTNFITGAETLLDKKVVRVPNNTDSFFTKTQWSGIIEAQYQWKRFSLGFRYTKGLQPYIRYKDNAGEQKSEKNQSLQAFIRYEFWRSGKKK